MHSDPRYTLILIDAFLQRGHTDAEFATLHHFGSKARIASHRRYVTVDQFVVKALLKVGDLPEQERLAQ
jgi:hypothetical protein